LGEQSKSLSNPNPNYNVNPIALAISSGFTFVARSYSYDVRQLKDLITAAVKHKGLAFIDVLQPCPTYNDLYTETGLVVLIKLMKKQKNQHLEFTILQIQIMIQ